MNCVTRDSLYRCFSITLLRRVNLFFLLSFINTQMTDQPIISKQRDIDVATELTPLKTDIQITQNKDNSNMDAETKNILIKVVLDGVLVGCGK